MALWGGPWAPYIPRFVGDFFSAKAEVKGHELRKIKAKPEIMAGQPTPQMVNQWLISP